jgi:hypothetical protein
MKCKLCGKSHEKGTPHWQTISKLTDKGFPLNTRGYKEAHREANKAEKKKFGKKAFNEMKKVDSKLHSHELAGKNSKTGKIEVSKKVPSKYRKEVAYHEEVENKILRKKK